MITRIDRINEVRIPKGYFKATEHFVLPGKAIPGSETAEVWDEAFTKGQIIDIDPEKRSVKVFNNTTRGWESKAIDYKKFMEPAFYAVFKNNTEPASSKDLEDKVSHDTNLEFVTTIKNFKRRAQELGLTDATRLKIRVI